jgi:peptidoglycan hydrolase CwlO-like protein|tara:strand:- start:28 stop:618 length:591 start_codon:yes stop_codon:yes gene_type:complete
MLVNKNGKQSLKGRKRLEKTKKEIVTKPNQLIAIKVFDHWVDNLDSSTQESFCSFVSDNNSVIETYLYCRFLGYEGSVASCDAWIKDNYKKPDHRKKLLYEIDEMQEDIRKLREDIENGVVKRDAGVGRIAQMQKELRSTISEIENFTNMRDRKGLLMAGADRAIRELMFIFKDDPIETPLEEATMSVWARMQLEE